MEQGQPSLWLEGRDGWVRERTRPGQREDVGPSPTGKGSPCRVMSRSDPRANEQDGSNPRAADFGERDRTDS